MTEQNKVNEQESDLTTMKETKKPNLLNTKTSAVTLALIGGMAIGALFFSMPKASATKENTPVPTTEVVAPPEGDVPTESMMVQSDENGTQYSTDSGETWTEGTPPGTTVTEAPEGGQGMVTSSQGTPPPPGASEAGTLVKTSPDGTSEYSTDGGVTWTEGLPSGAESVTNPDGSQGVMVTEPGTQVE